MDLQAFFENFLKQIGDLLPGVLGAIAVLIIGWFVASGVSRLIANIVTRTGLQARLEKQGTSIDLRKIVKKFVYYILMAIVLMVVLEMLGVENVLQPLKDMISQFLTALPRIIGALIIGFVGYILATIVSDVVGLASGSIERNTARLGISLNDFDATKLLKQVVFVLIFVPLLIAALDYLQMKVISDPAKKMLGELMAAIPNILAAGIIIGVFYFVGRFVTKIVTQLLQNLNADELPTRLGVSSMFGEQSFSVVVGNAIFFFLMFFGIISAAEKLGMTQLEGILNNILGLTGNIAFGLVILAVGNFIAKLAHSSLSASDSFMADIARVVILGLFLAISLRSMGIADEIINLAFGLTLGSVAVAIALSFGLGGRDAAGRQMERILNRFNKDK